MIETVEKNIEIEAPLRLVFQQWTQFEEFPEFMEGVYEVSRLPDNRLRWKANIEGADKEWDAEIVEIVPDQRVSWRSISGTRNGGTVTFFPLGAERTRVNFRMDYEPEGALETLMDAFDVLSHQVEGDLKRFKQYVESRAVPAETWRARFAETEFNPEQEPRSKRLHGD